MPYRFETGHSALFVLGKSWPLNIYTSTKATHPANQGEIEFFVGKTKTQNGMNAADQQNGKLVTTSNHICLFFP